MAWLTGWTKRKKITLIGGSSGAQTDYQVKLTVTYDSDMQSDFDDLRFTQADGETLIDAWLETKTDDTSATVWAEFPTTPANTVEQTYYMYYGKSVVSDWNIGATFLFGDDFPGDTLDATKWNTDWIYQSGSASVSAGKVHLNCNTSGGFAIMGKTALPTGNFEIRTVGYKLLLKPKSNYVFEPVGIYTANTQMHASGTFDAGNGYQSNWSENGDATRLHRATGTTNTGIGTADTRTMNAATVYEQYLRLNANDVEWDINGTSEHDVTDSTYRNAVYPHFQTYAPSSTGDMVEIGAVFVRKYVASPPTYAFGAEENAPSGNPYWYYNLLKRRN